MVKIVDEKGRIFGKINIIDFLVILFLFCILPMFYFSYKLFTKSAVEEMLMSEDKFIEIKCQFVKLEPEVAEAISIGDKEINEDGEVIGEIIELGKLEPYSYMSDIGEGKKIIKEIFNQKQADCKLRLKVGKKGEGWYYKDKPIQSNFDFTTDKYDVSVVPAITGDERPRKKIIDFTIILKDLDDDIIKQISVGDKEFSENNEIIAEIISISKIDTNAVEVYLENGNFTIGSEMDRKQLLVNMRLSCWVTADNELYFKGKKVIDKKPIDFKLNGHVLKGIFDKSYKIPPPTLKKATTIKEKKWIFVQVKFNGIIPEIARVIQKGDIEKNAFGVEVGRISSIINNEPSQSIIVKGNELVALGHPFYKDVVVNLNILCLEKDGIYYFKDEPVKMGRPIVFSTDLYSISGMIVGLEMK